MCRLKFGWRFWEPGLSVETRELVKVCTEELERKLSTPGVYLSEDFRRRMNVMICKMGRGEDWLDSFFDVLECDGGAWRVRHG